MRRRSTSDRAGSRDSSTVLSGSRRRADDGQATIDYVALIAVLTVLVGAAAAVAGGGAANMTNAVLGQFRRALCVVTGGACPAERQLPCVVAGDRRTFRFAVSVMILRVGKDRTVVRERLSDGKVRLTLIRRSSAGVEAGIGARAGVRLRGRTLGSDREARGGVEGVLGWGEVFEARDDRHADEILRALRGPRLALVTGPEPREIFVEGGVRALGRVGLAATDVGASLDGLAEAIAGARRDQRSGEVTIALGATISAWALVGALTAAPMASADRSVELALMLDRRRRPSELSLKASGTLAAGATLMGSLTGPRGMAAAGQAFTVAAGGRRWELGARVDLRNPAVAAAWAAFRRDPTDSAAVRALGAQLREHAHLDVRSYALRSEMTGIAGAVALGVRLGAELDRTRDRSRLLTAATRPPGGLWEQRIDCVGT